MVDDDLIREKGLDHIGQTGHAVLAARPDMTDSDALRAVNTWRRGLAPTGA